MSGSVSFADIKFWGEHAGKLLQKRRESSQARVNAARDGVDLAAYMKG